MIIVQAERLWHARPKWVWRVSPFSDVDGQSDRIIQMILITLLAPAASNSPKPTGRHGGRGDLCY